MASRDSASWPGRGFPGRSRSLALKMAAASVLLSCSSCAIYGDQLQTSITVENHCARAVTVLIGEGNVPSAQFDVEGSFAEEIEPGDWTNSGSDSESGHFTVAMRGPNSVVKKASVEYTKSNQSVRYTIEGETCEELGADGN